MLGKTYTLCSARAIDCRARLEALLLIRPAACVEADHADLAQAAEKQHDPIILTQHDEGNKILEGECAMPNTYTAITKQDSGWWIGWIEAIPGINCQEHSRESLLASLKETLLEAVEGIRQSPETKAAAPC